MEVSNFYKLTSGCKTLSGPQPKELKNKRELSAIKNSLLVYVTIKIIIKVEQGIVLDSATFKKNTTKMTKQCTCMVTPKVVFVLFLNAAKLTRISSRTLNKKINKQRFLNVF